MLGFISNSLAYLQSWAWEWTYWFVKQFTIKHLKLLKLDIVMYNYYWSYYYFFRIKEDSMCEMKIAQCEHCVCELMEEHSSLYVCTSDLYAM